MQEGQMRSCLRNLEGLGGRHYMSLEQIKMDDGRFGCSYLHFQATSLVVNI